LNGGLGSLACEVVAENGIRCKVVRVGATGSPSGVTGSEDFLNRRHGLDCDSLAATGLNAVAGSYA
jgi:transketolase C-terminal domain/subunit